jgi:hypothetical protein
MGLPQLDATIDDSADLPFSKQIKGIEIAIRVFELDEGDNTGIIEVLNDKRKELEELLAESQDLV